MRRFQRSLSTGLPRIGRRRNYVSKLLNQQRYQRTDRHYFDVGRRIVVRRHDNQLRNAGLHPIHSDRSQRGRKRLHLYSELYVYLRSDRRCQRSAGNLCRCSLLVDAAADAGAADARNNVNDAKADAGADDVDGADDAETDAGVDRTANASDNEHGANNAIDRRSYAGNNKHSANDVGAADARADAVVSQAVRLERRQRLPANRRHVCRRRLPGSSLHFAVRRSRRQLRIGAMP